MVAHVECLFARYALAVHVYVSNYRYNYLVNAYSQFGKCILQGYQEMKFEVSQLSLAILSIIILSINWYYIIT